VLQSTSCRASIAVKKSRVRSGTGASIAVVAARRLKWESRKIDSDIWVEGVYVSHTENYIYCKGVVY